MLRFEIKKILSKPINKVVLIALIVIVFIGGFLTIRDVQYTVEPGNTVSGISAGHYLKNEKNKWKGNITEQVLKQVVEENNTINATEQEDMAFVKEQGLADIKQMINLAFSGFNEYDYYKADSISAEEARGLYEKRISNLKEWLNTEDVKDTFSEKEKEFLISQYESLEIPFHYEYTDGWKALLDSQYLPTLTFIVVLAMGLLVSGIFSDEFQLKADSIFFSTRLGRNKAVVAKIGASFLVVTCVYWATMVLYSIIVLGSLGFGGAECAIQTGLSNWNSFYNISYLQDYFLTMFGGYIGSLFILAFSMLISAKTHSTVLATTIPFILVLLPPFLGKIGAISRIMVLFPDQLLQISKSLEYFRLYEIAGKVVGSITLLVPLYLLLYFVIIPVLYLVYKKAEVK